MHAAPRGGGIRASGGNEAGESHRGSAGFCTSVSGSTSPPHSEPRSSASRCRITSPPRAAPRPPSRIKKSFCYFFYLRGKTSLLPPYALPFSSSVWTGCNDGRERSKKEILHGRSSLRGARCGSARPPRRVSLRGYLPLPAGAPLHSTGCRLQRMTGRRHGKCGTSPCQESPLLSLFIDFIVPAMKPPPPLPLPPPLLLPPPFGKVRLVHQTTEVVKGHD